MINSFVIYIFGFFTHVIGFLIPNWGLPDYVLNTISPAFEQMRVFEAFFPVATLMDAVFKLLTFEFYMVLLALVWRVICFWRGVGVVET